MGCGTASLMQYQRGLTPNSLPLSHLCPPTTVPFALTAHTTHRLKVNLKAPLTENNRKFLHFLNNDGNTKMLFLVSAPSRLKTDKVVIGYPDFPGRDSSLFPELIVDFEVGVKNRLAGLSHSVIFGIFTLCSLCVSLQSYFDQGRLGTLSLAFS